MEEFKAKKIIESLESIAAEESADALTGEVIEECCKVNGVSPEDFRNFIRENIDLQKLKELQELEEISLEKLDQVAGGVQPAKRGLASFLAATSLLGSAANFTASADSTAPISARRDMRTAQTVNRPTSATKNGRGKKKQSDWTESDIRTAIGLGTFAVCAPIIAWWALSPQKNNNSSKSKAQTAPRSEPQNNPSLKYSQFEQLLTASDLNSSDNINRFCKKIRCDFPATCAAITQLCSSHSHDFALLDSDAVRNEIGSANIDTLKVQLQSINFNPGWNGAITPRSTSLSSIINYRNSSCASQPVSAHKTNYAHYKYQPITTHWKCADRTRNKKQLTTNANTQIAHLGLNPSTVKLDAQGYFEYYYDSHQTPVTVPGPWYDPRRGIVDYNDDEIEPSSYNREDLATESNHVYDLGADHCHVYDFSGAKPIQVEAWAGTKPIAHLWWCNMFSLPALFAINAALTNDKQPGLDPNTTAVQNAANAVSPGGDILKGAGTQEESLMMDTCAYAILNSVEAHKNYYLPNRDALYAERRSRNKELQTQNQDSGKREDALSTNGTCMPDTCAVPSWEKTGIPTRVLYCPNVLLRNANHGETINLLTIAAPSWNPKHAGTYMGPKEENISAGATPPKAAQTTEEGESVTTPPSPYEKLVIGYWNSALSSAYCVGARNLIFTRGGGGAFKGDPEIIDKALAKVLANYGPSTDTCWARCFDHIGYAVGGASVKVNLYDQYNHPDAPRTHITYSDDKGSITCERTFPDSEGQIRSSKRQIAITWLET